MKPERQSLIEHASSLINRIEAIEREFSIPFLSSLDEYREVSRFACALPGETIAAINSYITQQIAKVTEDLRSELRATGITKAQIDRYWKLRDAIGLATTGAEMAARRGKLLEERAREAEYAAKCAAEAEALRKEIDAL